MLGALPIQGDFDDCAEAGAKLFMRQQGNAALDHAAVDEALDAPQTGGRRDMNPLRQVLVAQGGVLLQDVEQPQISGVEADFTG